MKSILNYIQGDKSLWAAIFILSLCSFLPVYSASSNLQYIVGSGTTTQHFIKHASFIVVGLLMVFGLQKINYKYFGAFAVIAIPFTIIALIATIVQGTTIEGASASRWLKIPGTGIGFQTSVFAAVFLMIYVARYLTKNRETKITLSNSILPLCLPIFLIVALILPENGSMGLLITLMVLMLLVIAGYPFRILLILSVFIIASITIFIVLTLSFPEKFEGPRVETWKNRVERFTNNKPGVEDYQVMNAKAAIVVGGVTGVGFGKSSFKQVLPQSTNDFIFAIVVEEGGLLFSGFLIFLYLFILFRIIRIATKIHTHFGTLLVIAVGIPIITQAFLNMAVAVNLLPVTGQPLPLISYGGTSMWVTYIALGIIISVSTQIKSEEELAQEKKKQSEAVIEDIA